MLKQRLLLLGLLLAFPLAVAAQGTIQGTVVDASSGEPLFGVQVVIPSITIGATTDLDGRYEIPTVPSGEVRLEARYIGYSTATRMTNVSDGETVVVDFELNESVMNLDEVVVTGAGGPVEKKKLGNSIATINVDALETAPVSSFSDVLQGREPGVTGLPSSGVTGEGSRIRIRGSASLSQSNEPIVYIDGVRVDRGGGFGGFVGTGGGGSPSRLDDINPDAISRIEVLKGAAAATLYGTEASNGVIQIFTKQGNVGPPKFSFQVQQGLSWFPEVYPNNSGYARTSAQATRMSTRFGKTISPYEVVEQEFVHDLFGTGMFNTYSASVSGGAPGVTYFISGRWNGEDGPFDGTESRLYPAGFETRARDVSKIGQFNANVNVFPTANLQLRASTGYTNRFLATFQNNNNIYGVASLAMFGKPELACLQDCGSYRQNLEGTIAFATVNEAMQVTNEQRVDHFYASVGANFRPFDWFTLDATVGADVTNQRDEEFWPFGYNLDNFASNTIDGARYFGDRNNLELTFDLKGTARNEFGENFESTFLVGSQGFVTKFKEEGGEGIDFPGPGLEVANAANDQRTFEFIEEVVNLGVFAQEQIGWNDWVYVTIGGRLDANSAFGSNFDAVFYPKVQASLPVSDAPWWTPMGSISSLRFRAALGQSGLQPETFAALTTFIPVGSSEGGGVAPGNLGNPELQPEVSTEWEVGAELGLLSDRLGITTTYWDRTVSDALVDRQFAPSGGFRNRQLDNIGEVRARGVEVGVNALVANERNYSINLFANAAYIHEEVTDLGGAPPIKVGGSYPRYRNFIIEGYAPASHFGAKLKDVGDGFLPVDFNGDGAADSRADVLAYLAGLTPATASLPNSTAVVLLADEDGDGDPLDHYLGKPTADWTGSFGGSFSFLGDFTVNALFEYAAGNFQVNNLTNAFRQAHPAIGRNIPKAAKAERDYVTGGVDASFNPQNDPNVRMEALETWLNELLALSPFSGLNTIKDADFLRLRELGMTYRVPRSALRYLGGVRNASVTVAGRNLAIWTKYDGLDPETNAVGRGSGNGLSQNFLTGVEAFGFPLQRRVMVTLRFGF